MKQTKPTMSPENFKIWCNIYNRLILEILVSVQGCQIALHGLACSQSRAQPKLDVTPIQRILSYGEYYKHPGWEALCNTRTNQNTWVKITLSRYGLGPFL